MKIPAAFRSVRVSNQLRHGSLWLCRLTGEDTDVVAYVVRALAAKRPTRRGQIVLEGSLERSAQGFDDTEGIFRIPLTQGTKGDWDDKEEHRQPASHIPQHEPEQTLCAAAS
jgi:hypothetical protein